MMGGWYRKLLVDARHVQESVCIKTFSGRCISNWSRTPKGGSGSGSGTSKWSSAKFLDYLEPREEPVPYKSSTQMVLLKNSAEKLLGDHLYEKFIKQKFKGKILPSHHPKAARIQKMLLRIAKAGEEEILSDKRKMAADDDHDNEKSREKKGGYQFKWEVVLDNPAVNAICMPGGKIIVFIGLLTHLTTDNEIAAVIGHEVAHAVARHHADVLNKIMLCSILKWFLNKFLNPYVVFKLTKFLIVSKRREFEADYIGMRLMACAGYDPQAAPRMYRKLGEIERRKEEKSNSKAKAEAEAVDQFTAMVDYATAHPCGEQRAQLLSQPQVMEEALSLYRDALAKPLRRF